MKAVAAALLAAAWPGSALAGAWPLDRGDTQIIVKVERMRAGEGFDVNGTRRPLTVEREDDAVSVFAERGLTDRLTLQMRAEWQRGQDAFVAFEGMGPTEIGLRYQVIRGERSTAGVYVGYAQAGEGRNAGYAAPGAGEHDWDIRLLAGHSRNLSWLAGRDGFLDVQAGRRFRDGLADEDRLDLTAGLHLDPHWMVLNQIYAGRTTDTSPVYWVHLEASVVRQTGDWSLQAGWRQAVAGRGEVPAQSGPVFAIWRRF